MRGTRRRTKPPANSANPTARRGFCGYPGRLHVTWQDDQTLRMESDAGKQIRTFHFGGWKALGGAAHDLRATRVPSGKAAGAAPRTPR